MHQVLGIFSWQVRGTPVQTEVVKMMHMCLILVALVVYANADPCIPQPGVLYRIINRQSNKALNIRNQSMQDGAQIEQSSYIDGDCQKWKIDQYINTYVIISQHTNKALGIDPLMPATNGGRVQQWTYTVGGTTQRWRIQQASGGFCKITSELSDKALEVKGWSSMNGADIQIWDYAAGANQEWKLEVVSNQSIECQPGWGLIRKYNFTSVNNQEWDLINWPVGHVNHEKQSYNPKNVFTRNNHLVLKAIREGILPPATYTSGRVESKHTYSPFEAPGRKIRVEFTGKVPTPAGAWPAYWLLGDDKTYGSWPACGEIDVMEWVYQWSGIYPATIHYAGVLADSKSHEQAQRNFTLAASEMAKNFLTYGIEYSAVPNDGYIQYYFRRSDGQTFTAPKIESWTWNNFPVCPAGKNPDIFPCSTIAPFDNHMRIVINLAVGGDFGGAGVTDYTAFDDGVEFETSKVVVCEKL